MAFTVNKQTGTWLLILAIVAALLAGLQIVRVNQPKPAVPVAETRMFANRGPVLPAQVVVEPNNFFAHRLDLNRRLKLRGSFRTASLKSLVEVLVVRDSDFEAWKTGAEVKPILRTKFVPGGNLSPVLEPGIYHLIIDNRMSDQQQTVATDIVLE